jgi:CBS-domain-containing membrane protein
MKAMDVMVRDVVTVKPEADVASAIELLVEHDISALPVIDDDGSVVGVISEADLIRRSEIGTEKERPWWRRHCTRSRRQRQIERSGWNCSRAWATRTGPVLVRETSL